MIQPLWHPQNQFVKPEHNRYYQQVGQSGGQRVRHGTGSEKSSERMSQACSSLKQELFAFGRWLKQQFSAAGTVLAERVLIVLSEQLASFNSTVENWLNNQAGGVTIQGEVEVKSGQLLHDLSTLTNWMRDRMTAATPKLPALDHPDVLTDPHHVTKALRRGRVDRLYIHPNFDMAGYVTPNSHCYTYPVKGSSRVEQVRPWLLKTAIDTSAHISLSDDPEMLLAATTRYST